MRSTMGATWKATVPIQSARALGLQNGIPLPQQSRLPHKNLPQVGRKRLKASRINAQRHALSLNTKPLQQKAPQGPTSNRRARAANP